MEIDSLLEALAMCPPGPHAQIDDEITPRLRALIGKPLAEQAIGMKAILDDCAFGGLASDFAMHAMDAVWKLAKGEI